MENPSGWVCWRGRVARVPILQRHSSFPVPWGSRDAVSPSFPGVLCPPHSQGFCVPLILRGSLSPSFPGGSLSPSFPRVLCPPHSQGFWTPPIPGMPRLLPLPFWVSSVGGSVAEPSRASPALTALCLSSGHTRSHQGEEGTNVLPWAMGAEQPHPRGLSLG